MRYAYWSIRGWDLLGVVHQSDRSINDQAVGVISEENPAAAAAACATAQVATGFCWPSVHWFLTFHLTFNFLNFLFSHSEAAVGCGTLIDLLEAGICSVCSIHQIDQSMIRLLELHQRDQLRNLQRPRPMVVGFKDNKNSRRKITRQIIRSGQVVRFRSWTEQIVKSQEW